MTFNNSIKINALLLLLSMPLVGNAGENPALQSNKYNFIGIRGGVSQPTALLGNTKLNTGSPSYMLGFSVGRKLMNQLSMDLEYVHSGRNSAKNEDIDTDNSLSWATRSRAMMLNMIVDLTNVKSTVAPYVKLGVGIANNKSSDYIKVTEFDDSSSSTTTYKGKSMNSFAWQVGAGFNIETNSIFDIQIQYMFINLGKAKTSSTATTSYSSGISTTSIITSPRTGRLQQHVMTIGAKIRF